MHTHTPEVIKKRKKMFGVTRGRQVSIPGFHSEVRKIRLIGKSTVVYKKKVDRVWVCS